MRRFTHLRVGALLLAAAAAEAAFPLPSFAYQASAENPPAQASVPPAPLADPHSVYAALNALRPDGDHVFDVENLALERDVIRIRLEEGKLAFFQAIDGRVTGAVYSGQGHVIATPRDAGERRSLAQFLGLPILDQSFTTAYFRFTDATAQEMQSQLKQADADDSPDPQFAAEWSNIVADMNPGHSVRILEDLLSKNPLPYFSATLAGGPNGPIELMVDARRAEQVLIGQPLKTNGESFFDVWASFPATNAGDTGPLPAPVTFQPVDYQVDTTIAPDLSLTGATAVHLRAARAGERVVALELSKDLVVEKVTEEKKPLAFFQNENLSARQIQQKGNNFVFVVLPDAVTPGENVNIDVSYHGSVIKDAGNGVYFVGYRGAWYAHAPDLRFFTPLDLTFHWPRRLTLVATGVEGKAADDGDVRTARWLSEKPFAVAGFNLGDYTSETQGKSPVVRIYANQELDAQIAARLRPSLPEVMPNFPTAIGAGLTRPDSVNMQAPSVVVPSDVIRQLGTGIEDSIQFYEKMDGKFPFPEMQVSPIPGSFGQGWPGLMYLSTLAFLPPEAQQRAGLAQITQQETQQLLPYHEVVHQWWGNLTTAATYRDVWIEEGMATYQALMFADFKKPGTNRLQTWLEEYRRELFQKSPGKDEPIEQAGPLTLGYRLSTAENPDAYDVIVYDKGAWVIHMLRELMRDEKSKQPDARFYSFLQSVLQQYAYQPLTTAGFEKAAETQMTPAMNLDGSGNLRWFFDEWVYGTNIPRYSVRFGAKSSAKGFVVYGTLSQDGVDDTFTERIPLYSVREKGRLEFLGDVVTTGEATRFRFESRFKPERLAIDPHLTVLSVAQ
ncbi:MAG TPA: M1 family aminopeptidase [Verrucomicrobiae bacterium]|nr:M1 family aminopeptidase [Verrucomicrobiae bacterium]